MDQEIITSLPESFMRSFEQEILGTIPQEKVQADLRQAEIGRVLINEGSTTIPGLGQKLGEIDGRVWHRWNQAKPGCWQDKAFVQEFFQDNPNCKSPGWKPKTNAARHGFTYVNGEPVRPAPRVTAKA